MKITFWAGQQAILIWNGASREGADMIGRVLLGSDDRFIKIGSPDNYQFINLDNVTNVVFEEK